MSSKSTGVLSLLLQSPLGGTLVAWYSVGRGSTLVLVGPLALLRGAGITSRKIPRDQAPPDQRPTARRRPFSAANSASSGGRADVLDRACPNISAGARALDNA